MENSLAINRPDIAAEWDYEANGSLTPQDVTVRSNKKVGWKCSKDNRHRWMAIIGSRTSSNGAGCPFCSGTRPFIGETDLGTVRPDIAVQWDYEANNGLTPQEVTVSSGKIVGWKCSRNQRHRWMAPISNRTGPNSTGCPFCSGTRPFAGETDLGTIRPDIAAEWDYEANNGLTPQEVTVSSGKIVGWKCSRNQCHRWIAPISNRTSSNGAGCPFCSGTRPFAGETDLGTIRPDIAAEWDYEANGSLTPPDVTVRSNKKVGWKCSRNEHHRWKASISDRTNTNGTGCPFCSGTRPFTGETDLGTVRPDIAAEWDCEANNGLTPQEVTVSSSKIVGWKCSRNEHHRWMASISHRTESNSTGCPFCSGTRPFIGETDLGTVRPDIAAQWDYEANNGLTPQEITVSSDKIVGWKCSRDQRHRWKASISDRTRANGRGCPFCSGTRPFIGETDLGTVRPDIAAEWDSEANGSLTPQNVTVGSHKKVGWKCSRNEHHRWMAPISNRTSSNGAGCPFCSGTRPFAGETDLGTIRPDIAAEWDYEANGSLTPPDVTVRSNKKVGWKCSRNEHHRWIAPISNRTGPNSTGCPYCNGKPNAIRMLL